MNSFAPRHAVLLSLFALLAGCYTSFSVPPAPTPTPTASAPGFAFTLVPTPVYNFTLVAPQPARLPDGIGPDNFPARVNPLTGLIVDPAVLARRPVVAKISNAPPLVRPQAGLGAADLVFEHYAEGGLTRFSGVFYSQMPDRVGSVRSARLIDYELVPMYQALLAYSGASNGVNARIDNGDFAERAFMGVQFGQPYYFRDDEVEVPHNLFVNLAALSRLAEAQGVNDAPKLDGMAFLAAPPPGDAGAGERIDIRYVATRVQWDWNAERQVYERTSDGVGHFDGTTLDRISADNVVILFAEHSFTDIVESEFQGSVSYSIEIRLWFEGDAILFRDGRRYDARWWRPTREDMITLLTPEGDMLYFKPGNTWFQVMRVPEQQDPAEEGFAVE